MSCCLSLNGVRVSSFVLVLFATKHDFISSIIKDDKLAFVKQSLCARHWDPSIHSPSLEPSKPLGEVLKIIFFLQKENLLL